MELHGKIGYCKKMFSFYQDKFEETRLKCKTFVRYMHKPFVLYIIIN